MKDSLEDKKNYQNKDQENGLGIVSNGYDLKIYKYSNGTYKIIRYSKPIIRNIEKTEEDEITSNDTIPEKLERDSNGLIREDNLNRSYWHLVEMALENAPHFKTFWTLTFAENITDLTIANKHFNSFIQAVKHHYPQFMYLCVPEFQKRGAVHYHLMTNLTTNEQLVIEKQKGKKNMFNIKQWKHGFTSVFDLNLTDEKFSVAAYMTKYFWKDVDSRLFGRKKILASKNLKKPKMQLLSQDSKEFEKFTKYLEKYMLEVKEARRNVVSTKPYVPNMTIYKFKPK